MIGSVLLQCSCGHGLRWRLSGLRTAIRIRLGVRWWGVGNESWGCGGDMSPQEYSTLYRRFVTQFPAYAPKPFLVAVGPRGHSKDLDIGWTTGFFEAMDGHRSAVDGLSTHFYTDFRHSPERLRRLTLAAGMTSFEKVHGLKRSSRSTGRRWESTIPSITPS